MLVEMHGPFWLQTPDGSINFQALRKVLLGKGNGEGEEYIIFTFTDTHNVVYHKKTSPLLFDEMKEQLRVSGFIRMEKNDDVIPGKLKIISPKGLN